jgi:hypothetical protein
MIEADACSGRLPLFGRSFQASTPAAIEAGVDARDRAALPAVRRKHQRTLHLKHRNGEHIHRRRDHDWR